MSTLSQGQRVMSCDIWQEMLAGRAWIAGKEEAIDCGLVRSR